MQAGITGSIRSLTYVSGIENQVEIYGLPYAHVDGRNFKLRMSICGDLHDVFPNGECRDLEVARFIRAGSAYHRGMSILGNHESTDYRLSVLVVDASAQVSAVLSKCACPKEEGHAHY